MTKEIPNEELARMIAKGFDGVDKRFNDVYAQLDATRDDIKNLDGRMDHLDGRMDHLDARMGRMEADLNEIRGNIVYKFEFEDLAARVKYLESKLGVESGK